MNKVLSIKDIKKQYKQEWILISNPVFTKQNEIIEGRVAAHSKSRDEIYRKAKLLTDKNLAILFNGKIKQDSAIIL